MVESLTFSMGQLQRVYLSLVNNGQDNFTENDAAYGRCYQFLLCFTKCPRTLPNW